MRLRKLSVTLLTTVMSSSLMSAEISDSDLVQRLTDEPNAEALQAVFAETPDNILEVLAFLLKSEMVDPQEAITEALSVAPEKVSEIVELAREAGISNEIITTSALLAGLDPTVVSEATAAGIQTAATSPAIAPPTAPAIGSNGGGGTAVVSPN
ncbi:hypothetical protein EJ063_01170 [Vibrio aquaticus]|uniref:DUF2999 family protein n=1 Tax=Vibrio aquaticus TaxID=2496559 RepID=A0A432D0G5_9VIBR|nr:hypothetical protein [Vibrio aquaticus]RTZ17422.1 hypothetical protein EJ063_01170 [Vibrio aquaticus]